MRIFDWKKLFIATGILILLIAIFRGCIISCSMKNTSESTSKNETSLSDSPTISMYDDDDDKIISVSLEEYLVGVVAAEMPASFSDEALKAQAVAARTYTLRRINNGGCESGADICADSKCCQAYSSDEKLKKNWGTNYRSNMTKIVNAVESTSGQALYYNGELIEALYHAASGGQTEDSENVFASSQPYLRGVKSTNEKGSSHMTGTVTLTKSKFASTINKQWPRAKLNANKLKEQFKIIEHYDSGRVKSVKLNKITVTGREFRTILGLDSAMFSFELQGDNVIIRTLGYGHGVGMSQAGANGMAKSGSDYREILLYYYTGVEIR